MTNRPKSIRERIVDALTDGKTRTCRELMKLIPGVQSASLSCCLTKISKGPRRVLERVEKVGPRGGRGYRLRSLADIITSEVEHRMVKQITKEVDRQVLADLMVRNVQ